MISLLLLALLTSRDPRTPGAVMNLNEQQVCALRSATDRKPISVTVRRAVFKRYGIPWADRHLWTVDHLIPWSLGGTSTVYNLMPQRPIEAVNKDRLEMRLRRAVCVNHTISLGVAQETMRSWRP